MYHATPPVNATNGARVRPYDLLRSVLVMALTAAQHAEFREAAKRFAKEKKLRADGGLELRITRGHASKEGGYNGMRVSVVAEPGQNLSF